MFLSVKVNPLFSRDLELYICSTTGIFKNVKLTRVKLLHTYYLYFEFWCEDVELNF